MGITHQVDQQRQSASGARSRHLAPARADQRDIVRHILRDPPAVQAKLRVGSPDDSFEHEADHEADRVAEVPASALRRGAPLPSHLREPMERSFQWHFGNVRLHTDAEAAALTRAASARALSVGEDVLFADGAYRPDSWSGRALVAHELAHVVQAAHSQRRLEPMLEPSGSGAEREADRAGARAALGVAAGPLTATHAGVALTPTSDALVPLLSYSATDLSVTDADERSVIALLRADSDVSATVQDIDRAGMLDALLERVDEPVNRRDLLRLLGARLNAAARAIVEPKLQQLDLLHAALAFQLQYNLGRYGVTGSSGFDRTSYADLINSDATAPFTGSGATGVVPTDRGYTDMASTSMFDRHVNPIPGSLPGYLATLTPDQRRRQAELLLSQQISTNQAESYAGWLPSRVQVMRAAANLHRLEWQLVAAIILAEQRDQSLFEDARDFIGGAVLGQNTSTGLGQVTVTTAQRQDLFGDLLGNDPNTPSGVNSMRSTISREGTVRRLASDEFNIFAVARYLRIVANEGATKTSAMLPQTVSEFPGVQFPDYANHSSTWPEDNIAVIGMYYTSRPWTDDLRSSGWGEFVRQAYRDIRSTAIP
jgi:hypothetical protein